MSLVSKENMTTLRTATDSANTAKTAEADMETYSIAYAINSAANLGQTSVMWESSISDTVRSSLTNNGYIITCPYENYVNRTNVSYKISWEA